MSNRQLYLDRIRELKQDLEGELQGSKFVKEVEPFMLREAMIMLDRVESYINGYLQEEKFRGG
tara:strand:- start:286 stop:474 length:189 start_codon:yes stop_codon:yes gene_type:complete